MDLEKVKQTTQFHTEYFKGRIIIRRALEFSPNYSDTPRTKALEISTLSLSTLIFPKSLRCLYVYIFNSVW